MFATFFLKSLRRVFLCRSFPSFNDFQTKRKLCNKFILHWIISINLYKFSQFFNLMYRKYVSATFCVKILRRVFPCIVFSSLNEFHTKRKLSNKFILHWIISINLYKFSQFFNLMYRKYVSATFCVKSLRRVFRVLRFHLSTIFGRNESYTTNLYYTK